MVPDADETAATDATSPPEVRPDMTPRSSQRPLDVVIRIAIVGLTLGTAYIHSTLGGPLFMRETRGLALTGRVITAAAAIMVTVFASFMIGEDRVIKLFGLGLSAAVLIDAVVIRSVLVPAIMQLFGARAWWIPAWLDRILPRLAVEPAEVAHPDGVHATQEPALDEN